MGLFTAVKEKIAQYVDVHVKLIKLNFIGRTANLLGYFMFAMICLLLLMCILLYLGFGFVESFIALGVPKLGSFFITIGIYILFLLLIVVFRRNITRFFASGFIKAITEGDDDDDDKKENK